MRVCFSLEHCDFMVYATERVGTGEACDTGADDGDMYGMVGGLHGGSEWVDRGEETGAERVD